MNPISGSIKHRGSESPDCSDCSLDADIFKAEVGTLAVLGTEANVTSSSDRATTLSDESSYETAALLPDGGTMAVSAAGFRLVFSGAAGDAFTSVSHDSA